MSKWYIMQFFRGYTGTGKLQKSTSGSSSFMSAHSENYSAPCVSKEALPLLSKPASLQLSFSHFEKRTHFHQPSFSTLPSSRVSKSPQCQKLWECHCKDLESKWLMTNKLFGRWDGFQVLLSTKVKELQLSYQLTDHLNYFWR